MKYELSLHNLISVTISNAFWNRLIIINGVTYFPQYFLFSSIRSTWSWALWNSAGTKRPQCWCCLWERRGRSLLWEGCRPRPLRSEQRPHCQPARGERGPSVPAGALRARGSGRGLHQDLGSAGNRRQRWRPCPDPGRQVSRRPRTQVRGLLLSLLGKMLLAVFSFLFCLFEGKI